MKTSLCSPCLRGKVYLSAFKFELLVKRSQDGGEDDDGYGG